MGYLLTVYAADLTKLAQELAHPTLTVAKLARSSNIPPDVLANWDLLAQTVAQAVADGGGHPQGSLADYVVAVIDNLGHPYASLHHSSAGGDQFRDVFLPGPVADLIGSAAIPRILNRSLAGLTRNDHPTWGHLTAAEVTQIGANLGQIDPANLDAADLHHLADAIRRTASFNLAIITVYG